MSKRDRFAYRPLPVSQPTPFLDAQEAWFWFIRCRQIRYEGAPDFSTAITTERPCDPDDIYRAVTRLYRQKRLNAHHLRTLSQYGLAERTPDPRCEEEAPAAALWDEALEALDEALSEKGIVA